MGSRTKVGKINKELLGIYVKNAKSWSEIAFKCGYKSLASNKKTIKKRLDLLGIDYTHIVNQKYICSLNKKIPLSKKLVKMENYKNVDNRKLIEQLIKEKKWIYQCSICKLKKWRNTYITLDLDHIDGDKKNYELSNLRLICPACHSLTNTFTGKNVEHCEKIIYKCECGNIKTKSAKKCITCHQKSREVNIILKDYNINNTKLSKISDKQFEKYVVSSNKWMELYRKCGYTSRGCATIIRNRIKKMGLIFKPDYTKINSSRHGGKPIKKLENILSNKVSYSDSQCLKQRLINELKWKDKCKICGISKWHGKPLVLHLDHINGNHLDNSIKNLRILCPNCHRTYGVRGPKKKINKNIPEGKCVDCNKKLVTKSSKRCIECNARYNFLKNIKYRPPYDQLMEDLKELKYYTRIGKKYGVSDNCIRKWIKKYKKYGYTKRKLNTKSKKKTNKCLDCNNKISIRSKRCSKCNDKYRFLNSIKDRPTYDQLMNDLKELKRYVHVGKKYRVSDNCIRKWIKKYKKYKFDKHHN
jgi:Zn finger protein HypA/HybF involved in hydrogenase expression